MKKFIKIILTTIFCWTLTACTSPQLEKQAGQGLFAGFTSSVKGRKFSDWTGECEFSTNIEKICYVQQTIRKKHQRPVLMTTKIGFDKNKDDLTVIFEFPKGSGIDIEQGIQLKVDKNKPMAFEGSCGILTCTSVISSNQQLTEQFKKGKRVLVAFMKKNEEKPIVYPVSLKGFSRGLQTLK